MELKKRLLRTKLFNNDKYLDEYCKICSKDDSNSKYIEGHHIFPKSLSKFLNEQIDNSPSNFVILSYRNHIKAHILLALACNNDEMFIKLEYAVRLCIQSNLINKTKDNLRKELKKDLHHLQEFVLLKEQRYNIDLQFYKDCNKCKTLRSHDIINHLETGYSAHKYKEICDKYGLEHKFITVYSDKENKLFYNDVNKYKTIAEYCRSNNIISKQPSERYSKICKKYGWENKFKLKKFTYEENKKFYADCNQFITLKQYAIAHKKNYAAIAARYKNICKKYNWKNLFYHNHPNRLVNK